MSYNISYEAQEKLVLTMGRVIYQSAASVL